MVENNKSPEENKLNSNTEEEFSVGNIFEDFKDNSELETEIDSKQEDTSKDLFHYINIFGLILKYISIVLIMIIILSIFYITIQKSTKSGEILSPFCPLLLGTEIDYQNIPKVGSGTEIEGCGGLYLFKDNYEKALKSEKERIYSKLLKIATNYYVMKDFINSKEVVFLLDKSEKKKDPLKLLNRFDQIKNEFLMNDKLKIQCKNIKVSDNELKADCFAYSSLWDRTIPGYDGSKSQNSLKGGTSVSIASSFLNFLEIQDDLTLVNKQKIFKILDIAGEGSYSYKTPFTVKLQKRDLQLK